MTPRGQGPSGRFQAFSSLRHRDFRFLWLSNLANASASWFEQITIPWVVWIISGSPFWVGVTGGMRSLPFLFIGPLAGVFADRFDRRKIEGVLYVLMALVMFPIKLPYREEVTATKTSVKANLKQGFVYVLSDRRILHLLLLSYISALFVAPVLQIMPVIADEVLGHGFTPFASVLVGLMAEFTSANLTVAVVGAISLALALWAFVAYKDIRRMA